MKSLLSQLRWLFTPQDKRKFIFIAMLMALSALLELAGIGVLLAAATVFLSPESSAGIAAADYLARLLPQFQPEIRIAAAIGAIGILLAAKNLFAFFIVRLQSRFIFAKRDEVAHRIYKRFLNADFESFSQLSPDYCFASFTRLNEVGNMVLLPLMQLFADILVVAILTIASVLMFPKVSISGILFMLFVAGVVQFLTRRINQKNGERLLEASLEENRLRQTGIAGEKSIKCAAKEEFFLEKFGRSYAKTGSLFCKLYAFGQIPRLALESASILLACAVFIVMLTNGIPKAEILLTFAVLTAVVGRILPALSRGYYNLTLIKQNLPQLSVICDILKNLPQEAPATGETADAGKDIEFKDVSFAYKNGPVIFEKFNLTIEKNSSLAIAGRSGRGKSTLIDLLLGLLIPSTGSISAGGTAISGNLPEWRKQIGIVPQTIFLQEGTVAENVAFGEKDIDRQRVVYALKMAGLENFSPDFELTAQGNLSGGQRQRIGIARALYKDIKLLILDEATSALDAETENAFCELLETLQGKITMIVISHRESTLACCSKRIDL